MRLFFLSTLIFFCAGNLSAQICTVNEPWCNFPPVVHVDCICDIPAIDEVFRDIVSPGNIDVITFEGLPPGSSVTTNGNCGVINITGRDNVHNAVDCQDSFYIERVYKIFSNSQSGELSNCFYRFVVDNAPPNFKRNSQPTVEVSCAENVDSLFNDFVINNAYAEIQNDCGNNFTVQISAGAAYENLIPVSPECNTAAFTQSQFSISDNICSERCSLKLADDPVYDEFYRTDIRPFVIVQTITRFEVIDTIKPVFTTCPPSTTYDIGETDLSNTIEALLDSYILDEGCIQAHPINTNPDPDIPVVDTGFDTQTFNLDSCDNQTIVYNLTATDRCGNIGECNTTVTILNETGPMITNVPDTLKLECGNPMNQTLVDNWKAELTAVNFRGNSVPLGRISFDFDDNVLALSHCGLELDITFTAFDRCGRSASERGVITIDDTTSPVLVNCPIDTTVTADDPLLDTKVRAWLGGFQATDNCKPNFVPSNDFDLGLLAFNCGNIDTLVVFTADDSCSDPTECSAKLSILDNVTYDFVNFPNDTTITCESPVNTVTIGRWANGVTGMSSLGTPFPNVLNDLDYLDPRLISCSEVIEITFSFENPCGVPITRTATMTIVDDVAPTISCPADRTFSGDFDVIQPDITAWLGSAVADDNCGASPIWDYSTLLFDDCKMDTIPALITFQAQDNCGTFSLSSCSATLTIVSEKKPIITCPAPLILECGSEGMVDTIQSWLEKVVSTNFAGTDIPATYDLVIANVSLVECMEQTMVTFNVEDTDCDRSDNCMTSITIQDTQDPTITCPSNHTAASNDINAQQKINDWLAEVTFDDSGCSTPTLSTDPPVDNIDFCTQMDDITVTFTAIDMCNRPKACVSIISFDTSEPTVTCPSNDLPLECGDTNNPALIQAWLAEPTAADNAGQDLSLMVQNDFDLTVIELNCTQTIAVTFDVVDSCTRPSACSKNILINDTQAPDVTCPTTPLNLLAGDTVKIPKYLTWLDLLPVDDCNGYSVTTNFDENQLAGFDCDEITYDVAITITDDCGWITPCQASISIQNNITTTFMNCDPANNRTVECGSPTMEEDIRLWMAEVTAIDLNGNEFPTDPSLDASDPSLLVCNTTVPITFELSDQCGQAQSCSLMLTIQDTEQPIPTCPVDTSFVLEDPNFDSDVDAWLKTISGVDNCITSLSYSDDYSTIISLPACEASVTENIEFTVEDGCGNPATCISQLTVSTTRVPTITCPGNEVVECGDPDLDVIITDWLASVSGVDANNDPLQPVFTLDRNEVYDIACDGEVSILFQIQDNCNIIDSCRTSIIIEDTTAPIATCPGALTINSTDPDGPQIMQDWIDSYSPTDNCSTPIATIQSNVIVPSIFCNSEEEMSIQFYAEDACNLRDTCTAILTINKAIPIINCSANIEVECGADENEAEIQAWISTFSATDNNNEIADISNTYSQATLGEDCEISTPIKFTATDNCGGTSECDVLIIQKDNLAPEITSCPQSRVFDISEPNLELAVTNWLDSYDAVDQCNTATLSRDYVFALDAFDCGSEYDVTFTAVDDCGNVNDVCRANLAFENNLEVSITCPQNILVKCSDGTALPEIQTFLTTGWIVQSDDEYEVMTDLDLQTVDVDCTAPYTQEVIFTITDNCGNMDDCSSFIEFIPNASIYIPTTFRPGSGDENSFFGVKTNIAIEEIKSFRVYSRWGDLMYSKENFDPNTEDGWNGRNRLGNHVQGVYTYHLVYEDIFGNAFEKIATITLIE